MVSLNLDVAQSLVVVDFDPLIYLLVRDRHTNAD